MDIIFARGFCLQQSAISTERTDFLPGHCRTNAHKAIQWPINGMKFLGSRGQCTIPEFSSPVWASIIWGAGMRELLFFSVYFFFLFLGRIHSGFLPSLLKHHGNISWQMHFTRKAFYHDYYIFSSFFYTGIQENYITNSHSTCHWVSNTYRYPIRVRN